MRSTQKNADMFTEYSFDKQCTFLNLTNFSEKILLRRSHSLFFFFPISFGFEEGYSMRMWNLMLYLLTYKIGMKSVFTFHETRAVCKGVGRKDAMKNSEHKKEQRFKKNDVLLTSVLKKAALPLALFVIVWNFFLAVKREISETNSFSSIFLQLFPPIKCLFLSYVRLAKWLHSSSNSLLEEKFYKTFCLFSLFGLPNILFFDTASCRGISEPFNFLTNIRFVKLETFRTNFAVIIAQNMKNRARVCLTTRHIAINANEGAVTNIGELLHHLDFCETL